MLKNLMLLWMLADSADPSDRKEAVRQWAQLMVPLLVGIVFTLCVMWIWTVVRRARRIRDGQERRRPGAKIADAWEVAGQRAKAPTAEELRAGFEVPDDEPDSGAEEPRVRQSASDEQTRDASRAKRLREEKAGVAPQDEPAGESRSVLPPGKRPVVLVTGGAKRVGKAIAMSFARAGCDIIFTYHTSHEEAGWAAREFEKLGVSSTMYCVDFDDPAAVESFATTLADTAPRLDIVVHNASVYTPTPLDSLTAEEALRQYRVNALAPLVISSRLAPLLAASPLMGGGSVIVIADIHALGRPRRDFGAYAMSKAAVAEMVHQLARDMAPNVRVNGIAPGVVAWPSDGPDADDSFQEKYIRRIPLGRAGTPDDAAEAIRWLALHAHYITGEILRVDGGRWLT
jgi:pteridine reductase